MHGVKDLVDGEIQKRWVSGFAALVGGNSLGAAQDDFLGRIRAIAGRVSGAEEGDGGSAEGHGEVERARVASNDADGVAQKSHEFAEFSIVDERLRIAAG